MVVAITLMCNEGCTHCFVDATPHGEHMNHATLAKTGVFLAEVSPIIIQITGGEFTLHPNYEAVVSFLVSVLPNSYFILESNGWWFEREDHIKKIKRLLAIPQVYGLQIRTDERYYPNYKRIWGNRERIMDIDPKIVVLEGAINLVPLGRAKNLVKENGSRSPMCANLVLINQQIKFKSFREMVAKFEELGKFCVPAISPDGKIHAGESALCAEVGSVEDHPNTVLQNIQNYAFCGVCNLGINLSHLKRF